MKIAPETTTVIANPRAAAGRVAREWDQLTHRIRSSLGELMFVQTRYGGHAAELAAEAVRNGSRTVLSLGGDGTHHQVMNGILAAQEAPGAVAMGVIPVGTGGDFRRLLVGSMDVVSCLESLSAAEEALIDVGWMRYLNREGQESECHFLNMASFGVGGLVDEYVERAPKHLGGKVTFLAATLSAFVTYRHATVALRVDGEDVGQWTVNNVQIANGRYSGGGMCHAPMARLADGVLEVVVFERSSRLYDIGTFRRVYEGAHLEDRTVHHFRGRHIEAEVLTQHPALLDVDGEPLGRVPAQFKAVPRALRLLNPRPDVL